MVGSRHFGSALIGWTRLCDLFDYIDRPKAPSGFHLTVQGVHTCRDKVLLYDGCTVVFKFEETSNVNASCQPTEPGQDSARTSRAADPGTLPGLGRHTPRRFERESPPPPDPADLLRAELREEAQEDLIEMCWVSLLVFAPRFQHESYQLELELPCELDHALCELADLRDSGSSEFFTELVPAFPQPDESFGSILAVPQWAGDISCVLIDCRLHDGKLFATTFRGRLNRKSVLLHLQLPDENGLGLFCGRIQLHDDEWRTFLTGETITVQPNAGIPKPPVSLADMLRDRFEWRQHSPSFRGPHFPAFHVLSDGGSKTILVDVEAIQSFSDFKVLCTNVLQYRSGNVNVCSSLPRVDNLSVLGQSCKAVLVATEAVHRVSIPPARLQLLRTIAFLDRRLLLRDFDWVVAEKGLLDLDLFIESQSDDVPPGFVINVKGAHTEFKAGRTYLRIPNATLLTLTFVEEAPSSFGVSEDDSDSDPDSDDSTDLDGGEDRQGCDDETARPDKPRADRSSSRSRSPPKERTLLQMIP